MSKKRLYSVIVIVLLVVCGFAASFGSGVKEENNREHSEVWQLTNYADASGNQGMFYTLYNDKTGDLIVVDGGWEQNAQQVREVIEFYGGHVTAWFLTHYDNDHVDAFNVVYGNPGKITIDKIYVTPLDYDTYMSNLREWDTPASYQRFLELTQGADNIVPLSRGDEFEVAGLSVKVFNAYDDVVTDVMKDLPNICSLVFKITGQKDSILFCGDCRGGAMSNILLDTWGDELAAEYVQLGHHGNGSLIPRFYDAVNPQVALFDAPAWLMTDEKYSAKKLKGILDEKGVNTYDFSEETVHSFYFE